MCEASLGMRYATPAHCGHFAVSTLGRVEGAFAMPIGCPISKRRAVDWNELYEVYELRELKELKELKELREPEAAF